MDTAIRQAKNVFLAEPAFLVAATPNAAVNADAIQMEIKFAILIKLARHAQTPQPVLCVHLKKNVDAMQAETKYVTPFKVEVTAVVLEIVRA